MYIDALASFCYPTSAILNNTNAIIGNVMDTQIGTLNTLLANLSGQAAFWVVQVSTTFSGGTSAQFQLVTDSVAALTTSRTVHLDTGAVAVGSLVAPTQGSTTGYTFVRQLPPDLTFERFMGVWETTVGNVTAGQIKSFITTDVRRYLAFADAI